LKNALFLLHFLSGFMGCAGATAGRHTQE